MPTVLTHIKLALLFAIMFCISSVIWDMDHFQRCSPKNLVSAASSNNQDQAYQIENQSKRGCRGFTHEVAFGLGFAALFLGYVVHMLFDWDIISL